MKKFLAGLLIFILTAGNVLAAVGTDVSDEFWAEKEISSCVNDGIISLYDDGSFQPEKEVKRAEFNSMLLRALGHALEASTVENKFSDVNSESPYYDDILKSDSMGLIYGYPDGTFRPDANITKSEVASIISHITKDEVKDVNVLNQFTDAKDVPAWVKNQFAKSIELDIYVNYPDAQKLLPNKNLDRAEAAVILYKLKNKLNAVKDEYVPPKEEILGTEHLNISDKAATNEVTITNMRKIILAGNVLKVNFAEKYNSSKSDVGSAVNFTFKDNVFTKEGTLVVPANTTLAGYVQTLEPQKKFNKNAKVTVTFKDLTTPNGQNVTVAGRVIDNDGVLTASKLKTIGKVAAYTAGGAAIGTGASVGFASIPNPHNYGTGVAIGLPVGAGVGLIAGLVTPGLAYKADTHDSLYIELTEDLSIYNEQ